MGWDSRPGKGLPTPPTPNAERPQGANTVRCGTGWGVETEGGPVTPKGGGAGGGTYHTPAEGLELLTPSGGHRTAPQIELLDAISSSSNTHDKGGEKRQALGRASGRSIVTKGYPRRVRFPQVGGPLHLDPWVGSAPLLRLCTPWAPPRIGLHTAPHSSHYVGGRGQARALWAGEGQHCQGWG